MSTLNEAQEIFNTKTTPEIAEYLIGMYVENVTQKELLVVISSTVKLT